METIHNRVYQGITLGFAIRKQIGHDKIFRVRKGNGFFDSIKGAFYQDQYDYFVPLSINNPESEPYRRQWVAAVHKWKYDLSDSQKTSYNKRAQNGLKMSGYNLFMREAMKGLIDMYIDRGDPSSYDYSQTDLTIDGLWHDLDLSGLVTAGAKLILLEGEIEASSVGYNIEFRKNGNSNEINHCGMESLRNNEPRHRSCLVACDNSQKIEYKIDNQTWTTIDIAVRGWFT